jgi:hypothetical protein
MQRRLFNFVAVTMSLTTASVVLEHSEFGAAVSRSLIERDVIGEVRWHF